MTDQPKPRKPLQLQMRAIHRVLGYLAAGLIFVFSLSGITLVFRTGDFLKKETHIEKTIAPGLDSKALADALKFKKLDVTDETPQVICFAEGQYDKTSGVASYTAKQVVQPMNSFIGLHKISSAKNGFLAWSVTVFGAVLFLLALTALFMYKPGTRQFRANMIYTVIGIAFATLLVLLV